MRERLLGREEGGGGRGDCCHGSYITSFTLLVCEKL